MEQKNYIGIDVSKDTLDVSIYQSSQRWGFPNDQKGISNLISLLNDHSPELVVLEATSSYEVPLAAELGINRIPTAVVNPRQVRDFARSAGILAKTDTLDAMVIARFAATIHPIPRPIADEEAQELGAIIARRRQIVGMGIYAQNV
jgi:transposase